jgi:deoxyribonuclease V
MDYHNLHPWKVSPQEAIHIQTKLQKKVILTSGLDQIKRIAGADISYSRETKKAYGAIIIFSFPELEILETEFAVEEVGFPYIPGLLTFREGPVLLKACELVKDAPDVIIFDGQGIAHPRRIGLATHLGILLDRPTIGCAKSKLTGRYSEPDDAAGSYTFLKEGDEIIGAVVRARKGIKPLFVSSGYRINLASAIEIVLKCIRGYRLPEPTRQAHLLVNKLRIEDRSSGDMVRQK